MGRIAKCGTMLRAFDIKYIPRTFVKGQVFADFVAEFVESPLGDEVESRGTDGKSVGMVSL